MAGGRKTVNRKFVLYSEQLLEDYKVIRAILIILHILCLLLGITAFIIGIFAYIPTTTTNGSASLPFVNCTLSPQIQPGVQFPVHLMLLLTGIGLISIDVSASFLLCAIKYINCGVISILWFLGSEICITAWTIWSIVYVAVVFPVWQSDRRTCDDLIMIGTIIGVGVMTFIAFVYAVVIVVVTSYDCWYRCDVECCSQRRDDKLDDF